MIEIENLYKKYNKINVLNDVNLKINDSEFIVVLGPSGCGKTTFLRMISGLENPTSGDIKIEGKSILKLSPKDRNISMVFQNYALFPDMSVYQNIAFGLKIQKFKKSEIEKIIIDISKKLKIENLLKRKPDQLSGGEQQRVALARAMVKKPKIYLFDEPLSNLDVNLKEDFMNLIKKIHKETKAIFIYVTHSQQEALKLADKIVLINNGKILQVGSPFELYEKPKNLFAANFIGEPKINILALRHSDRYLGIRPEKIKFGVSLDSLHLNFVGKISNKEFVGNGYIYYVAVADQNLKIFSDQIINKDVVNLVVDKKDILVFDKNEELSTTINFDVKYRNNCFSLEEII